MIGKVQVEPDLVDKTIETLTSKELKRPSLKEVLVCVLDFVIL